MNNQNINAQSAATPAMNAWEKQGWHALALAVLGGGAWLAAQNPGWMQGEWGGFSTRFWFACSAVLPAVHQIYVAVLWRSQLKNGWVTRRFPRFGYQAYLVVFKLLLVSRPVLAVLLALSNRGGFALAPFWRWAAAILLGAPGLWLLYSVLRYFGINRASGADHFDPSYRNLPLENRGIFRYTRNGMYWFGFFLLWLPGFLWASPAALAAALYSHLYIWVHYYCTEKPDMNFLYQSASSTGVRDGSIKKHR